MPLAPDEQVKKIDDEISQLKARKQAILNREKQKQKKERTCRLIRNGELAEKYLNCEGMPSDKFETILQAVVSEFNKRIGNN